LVCAALAEGPSTLLGALDSDDTRVMVEGLARLGIHVERRQLAEAIHVAGQGGRIPATRAELFCGNSGTTIRFLTAVAALGRGEFRLDGTQRMRQRPIQDLLDALVQLGSEAKSAHGTGCPPVVIRASGIAGGRARLRGDVSSQYLSAILMAAPYARSPVELWIEGNPVSQPYVALTRSVMESFGVTVGADDWRRLTVPTGRYRGRTFAIEPDATAASYFFAAAAITGGKVTVEGISRDSRQGDVAFCDLLARMGCTVEHNEVGIVVAGGPLVGIDADLGAISDTVQSLAAAALFAAGPTTIRNVAHIRHKETDRIGHLAVELRKLGAEVDERPDGLVIVPPTGALHGTVVRTYDDHRMAMSLALVGLRTPGVVIDEPRCTAKTYPRFFADLATILTPPAR
jgi:3-phosphoshikimate 1-carboxyvinyltransferase